jgi:hypothetical protein
MKKLTLLPLLIIFVAAGFNVPAQSTAPAVFIKGSMNIKFNTQIKPAIVNAKDVYTLNVNVCNSAAFYGTIVDTPLVMSGWINPTVSRQRSLYYDINCDVISPKTGRVLAEDVSRLYGTVPIGVSGIYDYNSGSLEFSVLDRRAGSDSKFSGFAAGKPLNRPSNWLDKVQLQTVYITRIIKGKTQQVVLSKYDKMEYQNLVLAAGPLPIYQTATATGELYYDYDKFEWFIKNVTVDYAIGTTNGDVLKHDRLTGTIRWVPDAHRATTGTGEYQFDVRVNEPIPTDDFVSSAPASDESAFTETDDSVPSLTGTMQYKDTLDQSTVDAVNDPKGNNATTLASVVTIDLAGNNISKQQAMILFKMLIIQAVVPMNSD